MKDPNEYRPPKLIVTGLDPAITVSLKRKDWERLDAVAKHMNISRVALTRSYIMRGLDGA